MTPEVTLLITGSAFLAIATIGGGIEVQQLRIPAVPFVGRALSFLIAVLFLLAATSLIVREELDTSATASGPPAVSLAPTASVLGTQDTRTDAPSTQPTLVPTPAAVVPAPEPEPIASSPEPPAAPARETSPLTSLPAMSQALAGGLFCRDLMALGHNYAQAVDYWYAEDAPDRMDADLNGIPCETVYPTAAISAYWAGLP